MRFSLQLPFLFFFFYILVMIAPSCNLLNHYQLSALILCTLHHQFTLAIEKNTIHNEGDVQKSS